MILRKDVDDHVNRYNSLVSRLEDLVAQSEADRQSATGRSDAVSREFEGGLARVWDAVEQVRALVESGVDGIEQGQPNMAPSPNWRKLTFR